jgi:phage head maturation protease
MYKNKLQIQYQVKSNQATYKEVDINARTIKAIVNTYNFFDYDYDVLLPGAAKKSIQERGAKSNAPDKILHALFHDLTKLPGKSIAEAETVIDGKYSLYAESKLLETQDGEDTLIKYKEGVYNQHSIGFRYLNVEAIGKQDSGWSKLMSSIVNPEDAEKVGVAYLVKEIQWWEYSTVAYGANKLTPYLGTKSENKEIQLQNVYAKLKALITKAKRLEIKDKHTFQLQYRQLKQLINEIVSNNEPSKFDIAASQVQPSTTETQTDKRINYDFLTKNF